MSTYLTRIIQVRVDGAWETVKWTSDRQAYAEKPGPYVIDSVTDGAGTLREALEDSNYSDRGLPPDIKLEPEVAEQIRNRNDYGWDTEAASSSIVPGYNRYSYSATYMTLAELSTLTEKLRQKWFKDYEEAILSAGYVQQVNAIYDKLINNKKPRAIKESYSSLEHIKDEQLYDWLALENESAWIAYLVDEMYGYKSSDDVRIIMYHS